VGAQEAQEAGAVQEVQGAPVVQVASRTCSRVVEGREDGLQRSHQQVDVLCHQARIFGVKISMVIHLADYQIEPDLMDLI